MRVAGRPTQGSEAPGPLMLDPAGAVRAGAEEHGPSMFGPAAFGSEPFVPEPSAPDHLQSDPSPRSDRGGRSHAAGKEAGPLARLGAVKVAAIAAVAVVVVGGGGVAVAMSAGGSDERAGGTVRPQPVADRAEQQVPVDPQQAEAERLKEALTRAKTAAGREKRKPPALAVKGTPLPEPSESPDGGAPSAGNPVPAGEAQRIAKGMLPKFGFDPGTQFGCLVNLWNRESGWRTTAANPSGAYGIPQALPGSKMGAYGADWRTNPKTQITWGLHYIKGRYKTPCGAWAAFQSQGFY